MSDPFGHSNVLAPLMNATGFDAWYMNRIDYRLRVRGAHLAVRRGLAVTIALHSPADGARTRARAARVTATPHGQQTNGVYLARLAVSGSRRILVGPPVRPDLPASMSFMTAGLNDDHAVSPLSGWINTTARRAVSAPTVRARPGQRTPYDARSNTGPRADVCGPPRNRVRLGARGHARLAARRRAAATHRGPTVTVYRGQRLRSVGGRRAGWWTAVAPTEPLPNTTPRLGPCQPTGPSNLWSWHASVRPTTRPTMSWSVSTARTLSIGPARLLIIVHCASIGRCW